MPELLYYGSTFLERGETVAGALARRREAIAAGGADCPTCLKLAQNRHFTVEAIHTGQETGGTFLLREVPQ